MPACGPAGAMAARARAATRNSFSIRALRESARNELFKFRRVIRKLHHRAKFLQRGQCACHNRFARRERFEQFHRIHVLRVRAGTIRQHENVRVLQIRGQRIVCERSEKMDVGKFF